ncbi:MAG: hypothetical protein ACR2NV_12045 [Thermoleophilaceae bacterium]
MPSTTPEDIEAARAGDEGVTLDESVAPLEYNYKTKAAHERAGTGGYFEGEPPMEEPGSSFSCATATASSTPTRTTAAAPR